MNVTLGALILLCVLHERHTVCTHFTSCVLTVLRMLHKCHTPGDPMAHLVKKKENFDNIAAVLPEGFKIEGSGFKIPQGVSQIPPAPPSGPFGDIQGTFGGVQGTFVPCRPYVRYYRELYVPYR